MYFALNRIIFQVNDKSFTKSQRAIRFQCLFKVGSQIAGKLMKYNFWNFLQNSPVLYQWGICKISVLRSKVLIGKPKEGFFDFMLHITLWIIVIEETDGFDNYEIDFVLKIKFVYSILGVIGQSRCKSQWFFSGGNLHLVVKLTSLHFVKAPKSSVRR